MQATPVEIQAILERLEVLLAVDDATVNDVFFKSEKSLKQVFGAEIEKLGQQIASFNYPDAIVTLQSISGSVKPLSIDTKNSESRDENSPIDLNALIKLFGDDKSKQISTLKKFILQADSIVEEINSAHGDQEAEKISFLCHKLKSSARMVGADALADLCMDLEVAGQEADWLMIDALFSELMPVMILVKNYINEL